MQFSGPGKLGSIWNVLTIWIIKHSFCYTFFCFKNSITLAAKFNNSQLIRLACVVSTSYESMTEMHNRVQPVLLTCSSLWVLTNLDRVRLPLSYLISIWGHLSFSLQRKSNLHFSSHTQDAVSRRLNQWTAHSLGVFQYSLPIASLIRCPHGPHFNLRWPHNQFLPHSCSFQVLLLVVLLFLQNPQVI